MNRRPVILAICAALLLTGCNIENAAPHTTTSTAEAAATSSTASTEATIVIPGVTGTTAADATEAAETEPSPTPTPTPTPVPVDPAYAADPYAFISGIEETGGITVFGGFEAEDETEAEAMQQLQQASDDLLYRHSFIMIDINTGRGVGYNLDEVYYTASSIKGPFAASFCALAPEIAVDWESTIISMLQYSDNDAYRVLNDTYHRTYIQEWAAESCVDPAPFAWKYPHISARQMAALWLRNYEFFEQDEWGAQVGSWFESPEYSIINETVGELYTTRSKGGWLVDEDPDHAVSIDAGIVYADNGPYIVVIMSRVPSSLAYLGPIMEALEAVYSSM